MIAGDVAVIPGNAEHEGLFLEDTEVVDVFAPPREDFFAGATPSYMRAPQSPAMLSGRCARKCNRFIVPIPFVRFGDYLILRNETGTDDLPTPTRSTKPELAIARGEHSCRRKHHEDDKRLESAGAAVPHRRWPMDFGLRAGARIW